MKKTFELEWRDESVIFNETNVSAILSNVFSNIALGVKQSISPVISNPSYCSIFFYLGLTGIVVGIVLFFLKPLLVKLMGEN